MSSQPTLRSRESILRYNRRAALQLPAPEETWTRSDIDAPLCDEIRKFSANHLIERVGHDLDTGITTWRTNAETYAWIQARLDRISETPCGNSGVRNLRDGPYTCTADDCECRFGEEIAREVIRG